MSNISDLTGTKWTIDILPESSPLNDEERLWLINFTSNGNSYNKLGFYWDYQWMIDIYYYQGNAQTLVWNGWSAGADPGVWTNSAYRTIEIIDGDDVTDSDLIDWLEANAIQQLSVDLSTLTGWSSVTATTHTLTIKAKGTGYRDSVASQGALFTKALVGYTLSFTANAEADIAFIYYKTTTDQSGTASREIWYGTTQTIQNCTAFSISGSSGAYLNSISGTIISGVNVGDSFIIDNWYELGTNVTIDVSYWV